MDIDDLNSRLKRLYLSINNNFDQNLAGHITIKHQTTETGGTVSVSFGNEENKLEILNQINSVIAHLSKLKDHLKKKLASKGSEPKLIENEIDKSEYLKLIIDLDNLEKHGKSRDSRSGRFPEIVDVGRALSQKNIKSPDPAFLEINPFSGQIKWGANTAIVITAKIKDKDGKDVCSFTELVNNSIDKWEEIIEKFDLKN